MNREFRQFWEGNEWLHGLPVLRQVQNPLHLRFLGIFLLGMLMFGLFALVVVPWQQTAVGSGRVIAFTPVERQQTLEAPIKGVLLKWFVTEGSRVRKGTVIARMADNDPMLMIRLRTRKKTIESRIENARLRVKSYENKIKALESSRKLSLQAASLKIRVSLQKVRVVQQKIKAARASLKAYQLNWSRLRKLGKAQLVSQRSLEVARMKLTKARTYYATSKVEKTAALATVLTRRAERLKIAAEAQAKIDTAKADLQKARSDVEYAKEQQAKVNTKIARQISQVIRVPQDCTIVRLLVTPRGQMLKAGDKVAVIVPDTNSRAVELWVDGNDAPLIHVGRHVRLQFEGWPAVQFAGWPSVAVGTFGGRVALVDAVDNGKGKFRVLIRPDKKDEAWPGGRYLRQGVRAKGWVLLDQVRLGYELWRQFNGFPATSSLPKPKKKPKPPK